MPRRRTSAGRELLDENELFVGAKQPGAPLMYWEPGGRELARVSALEDDDLAAVIKDEVLREEAEAWDVTDRGGTVFSLRRYEAAEHPSYEVVDGREQPLGTFFCEGGLLHEHVLVRDDASAPVAEMETHRHLHEVRERHGDRLAACRRVFDPAGNDPHDEVWSLELTEAGQATQVLDRRVLVAAPLVCHLIGHPKRHIDPDCAIASVLLVAVPPVGGALIVAERAVDGVYWLRRKLD
jgi:hypothetical protein